MQLMANRPTTPCFRFPVGNKIFFVVAAQKTTSDYASLVKENT